MKTKKKQTTTLGIPLGNGKKECLEQATKNLKKKFSITQVKRQTALSNVSAKTSAR